jgi:hypothetical protein
MMQAIDAVDTPQRRVISGLVGGGNARRDVRVETLDCPSAGSDWIRSDESGALAGNHLRRNRVVEAV